MSARRPIHKGQLDQLADMVKRLADKKDNAFSERRFGTILYTDEILQDHQKQLQLLYSRIIPLTLDHNVAYRMYSVTACSNDFEPVAEGEEIPLYKAIYKTHHRAGKKITLLTFRKEG